MMPLYRFSGIDSFAHRLDPRTKLIFVLCYLAATFIVPQPWWMLIGVIAILWLGANIPPTRYLSFLLFLLPIFAIVVLIQTFFIHGGPFLWEGHLGPVTLRASQPGLEFGLRIASRLLTMGLAFVMFSMTTDPFHWGMAMYRWGLPYKVAFMFSFALRFFPLFQEEFLTVRQAFESRGSAALRSRNLVKRVRATGIAIPPVALSALRRSREIALAMEVRGFSYPEHANVRRTLFRTIELRKWDYALITAAPLAVLGLLLSSILT